MAEAGRGWVLTLWSSWALAFGCFSWPGGMVSGPRYCPRVDGLMRLRRWLSEDSWGEKGGHNSRVLGALRGHMAGTRRLAGVGQGLGSGARPLAPRPGGTFSLGSHVASWSLSPSVKWRQAHPFFPGEEALMLAGHASVRQVNEEDLTHIPGLSRHSGLRRTKTRRGSPLPQDKTFPP